MLSKNELDSLNIQEIDDLQAESISAGSFGFRRNRGRRLIESGYTRTVATNPGDTLTIDTLVGEELFFVTFLRGDEHLDVNIVRTGEESPVAPSGTTQTRIRQVQPLPPRSEQTGCLFGDNSDSLPPISTCLNGRRPPFG